MYRALTIVLIVIAGTACTANTESNKIQRIKPGFTRPSVIADPCEKCLDVAEQSIDVLLNLILDFGVVGSCQTLCAALANKTGQEALGIVCNIVCDSVGLIEFINLIGNADIDPIYYCELAKLCPVNDDGDCKITQFSLLPPSGPQGTTFTIAFTYVTVNGTGTGEIDIRVRAPDHVPLVAGFLLEEKKPGTYQETITIKAEPDPSCDPTEQPCEKWLPGIYNTTVQICNGECGSKHPHSAVYDYRNTSFTILTK